MGLVDLLDADQAADPRRMAASLRALLDRKRPSQGGRRIDLDGLERISSTLEGLTAGSTERRLEPISA
jgi:predicted glycosyltransferase